MGKTTLLRLIHRRQLKIPPCIDFLMVEQEIDGSAMAAIDAVLAADTKRSSLLLREKEIMKVLDARADDDDEDVEAQKEGKYKCEWSTVVIVTVIFIS